MQHTPCDLLWCLPRLQSLQAGHHCQRHPEQLAPAKSPTPTLQLQLQEEESRCPRRSQNTSKTKATVEPVQAALRQGLQLQQHLHLAASLQLVQDASLELIEHQAALPVTVQLTLVPLALTPLLLSLEALAQPGWRLVVARVSGNIRKSIRNHQAPHWLEPMLALGVAVSLALAAELAPVSNPAHCALQVAHHAHQSSPRARQFGSHPAPHHLQRHRNHCRNPEQASFSLAR